jgi:hypothetical protein
MKLTHKLTKLIRKIKYHLGKKEFVYDSEINNYIPDVVFERNVILYIISYIPEHDIYRMTVQQYNQGFDV